MFLWRFFALTNQNEKINKYRITQSILSGFLLILDILLIIIYLIFDVNNIGFVIIFAFNQIMINISIIGTFKIPYIVSMRCCKHNLNMFCCRNRKISDNIRMRLNVGDNLISPTAPTQIDIGMELQNTQHTNISNINVIDININNQNEEHQQEQKRGDEIIEIYEL